MKGRKSDKPPLPPEFNNQSPNRPIINEPKIDPNDLGVGREISAINDTHDEDKNQETAVLGELGSEPRVIGPTIKIEGLELEGRYEDAMLTYSRAVEMRNNGTMSPADFKTIENRYYKLSRDLKNSPRRNN